MYNHQIHNPDLFKLFRYELVSVRQMVVLILCLVNGLLLSGQPMDSIVFSKAHLQGGKYELNRFGISKIKIKNKGKSAATDDGIPTDEKVIEGIFTLLTGWETSSESESLWHLDNQVQLKGIERTFAFPVLVRGFYEKTRERVDNDDGSHSMESTETYNLFWDEGANGDIVENGLSLGYFSLSIGMLAYDSIVYWKGFLEKNTDWLNKQLDTYGYYDESSDFLLDVVFEDQPYTLVYHGDYFRCGLIRNGHVIGLWQDAPGNVMISKKKRINPYLLLPIGITDKEAQRIIALLTLGLSLARNQVY